MVDWGKQVEAIKDSIVKLDPRYLIKNPVMFVVEIGMILTLVLTIYPEFFWVRNLSGITGLLPVYCFSRFSSQITPNPLRSWRASHMPRA